MNARPWVKATVVTVSDRCVDGVREDRSGPVLTSWLEGAGHTVETVLVRDGVESVRGALQAALDAGSRVVLTTGGTGISPRDLTPEAVEPLLTLQIPGIVEQLRAVGTAAGVVGAPLTRGVAGLAGGAAGRAFVMTLPGSTGGCRDAVQVLDPLLPHVLEQIAGADH